MRTLSEIMEMTLTGGKPEYDELRYALCVMEGLLFFESRAIEKLADGEKNKKKPVLAYSAEFQRNESFNRRKWALGKEPKEYLGSEYDPDNPDYQRQRKLSKKIFDKVLVEIGYMGDVNGSGCDPSTM